MQQQEFEVESVLYRAPFQASSGMAKRRGRSRFLDVVQDGDAQGVILPMQARR